MDQYKKGNAAAQSWIDDDQALGAATTVLGVVPLIQDAFWVSMALTMMFGLMVGTVLTMVLVPTFYAAVYRIVSPGQSG